jgi:hypothetical protein
MWTGNHEVGKPAVVRSYGVANGPQPRPTRYDDRADSDQLTVLATQTLPTPDSLLHGLPLSVGLKLGWTILALDLGLPA